MELKLKGFQGYVKKTAAVLSDDLVNPRVVLQVEGTVKPLIEVLPEKMVYFQGVAVTLLKKQSTLSLLLRRFISGKWMTTLK